MLDAAAGWYPRGNAAKLLATVENGVVADLLELFYQQSEKIDLWETALTIETVGDRSAVGRLARALQDANPDRRHAAARALGWIPNAGRQAARALGQALADVDQPQPVREEAAESLAYLHYDPSIPILTSVLNEPDVRMRFWAVFALGGIGQGQRFMRADSRADPRIVEALERMLGDEAEPPGNWWPVGKEALAMLGELGPRYRAELDREVQRVRSDPKAPAGDRRWAEFYG